MTSGDGDVLDLRNLRRAVLRDFQDFANARNATKVTKVQERPHGTLPERSDGSYDEPVLADTPKTTKRRLAAVVSADAVGYSRLMSDDEDATIAALETAREIFRSRVAGHEGRVVDTAGDSVLAVFDSVVEVLQCAMEIQEELRRRGEAVPVARRMSFRVGVNVGELVEQSDGTVYGDGVNIAARLQGLAEPGGICVSEVACARRSCSTAFGRTWKPRFSNASSMGCAWSIRRSRTRGSPPADRPHVRSRGPCPIVAPTETPR